MFICFGHCSFFDFPRSLGGKSFYETNSSFCRVVFKGFLPFLVVRDSQDISPIGYNFVESSRTAEFCIFFRLDYGNLYFPAADFSFPGREFTGTWFFPMQFTLGNDCICNRTSFRSLRHLSTKTCFASSLSAISHSLY